MDSAGRQGFHHRGCDSGAILHPSNRTFAHAGIAGRHPPAAADQARSAEPRHRPALAGAACNAAVRRAPAAGRAASACCAARPSPAPRARCSGSTCCWPPRPGWRRRSGSTPARTSRGGPASRWPRWWPSCAGCCFSMRSACIAATPCWSCGGRSRAPRWPRRWPGWRPGRRRCWPAWRSAFRARTGRPGRRRCSPSRWSVSWSAARWRGWSSPAWSRPAPSTAACWWWAPACAPAT